MLEVDVRRTRDDVLILDHENVHLLDGAEVPICASAASLSGGSMGGEWGEALTTLPRRRSHWRGELGVGLMLDFKEPGTESFIARAIRKSGFPLERLLVAGASTTSRRILREPRPAHSP